VGVLLANLFYWVGAGLLWGEIHEQVVDSEYHFEGAFNSSTWYVTLILFIFTIPFSCIGLVKGGWVNNTKFSTFFGAMAYVGIGWGFAVQTNTVSVPGGGVLGWVSASIGNLNQIRIQWEETKRLCATSACTTEAQSFFHGFARPDSVLALGLGNNLGVIAPEVSAASGENEDDLQMVFVGLIFIFLSGYTLFTIASGKSQGIPFCGPVGSATWTPAYQSSVFCSMIAFAFGLAATFVFFGSDAAADPTHPFYENVMSGAASVFLVTFLCLLGVLTEEAQWLEASLFFGGFLTLGAPVRMWQMAALADTDGIAPFMSSNKYGAQSIAMDAEVDRYLIGGSLTIIATVLVLYVACRYLAADEAIVKMNGQVSTANPLLRSLRAVLLGGSFVGIWIAVGMMWSQLNDALEQVDATDSDRGNAGHYYVFLWLFAYFGVFINGLDAVLAGNADPDDGESVAAKIPFGALKPLFWVSAGLSVSMFAGYLSVGTHDRQLWFMDGSLANANEVRAIVGGPTDAFQQARAVGIDQEDYETVFTALIILFASIIAGALAAFNIPFSVRDTIPSTGFATWGFVFSALSFLCFVIGFCVLMALDLAAPTVEKAANQTMLVSSDSCEGIGYNMYLDANDACFTNHTADGERFTVNLFNPDPVNDYFASRYMQIFTLGAVAFSGAYFNFFGISSGSTIMTKASMYVFAILLVTVGYAMNWQGSDQVGLSKHNASLTSIYDDELCSEDGDGQCQSFKAGFTFLFLQAFFGIVAAAKVIGDAHYEGNVLNDDPKHFGLCGCGPCCKSGSSSGEESIEMSETGEGESRDAITGI